MTQMMPERTSNTEIGHLAYLPSRTSIVITSRVRSCRIRGLPRGKRESGERTLAGPKRAIGWNSSNCNAKPDLRCRARAAIIALC